MRPGTWFSEIWKRLRQAVVDDVPASLEECESCREVECTQERWLACERRLAFVAGSGHRVDLESPRSTMRTDEMLNVLAAESPQASSDESPTVSSDARPKLKSSSHD
jgi:hypothetical protein